MSAQNLTYLEANWLAATTGTKAISYFHESTTVERQWILRHHSEGSIQVEETWVRDHFDYLITFYNVVEIAVTIGFVTKLSRAFVKIHLPILNDPAVRRYYEVNYQLDLPQRLRERMQSGVGNKVPATTQLESWFYEFLELTKLIERDEDLESFLWALDGGRRDGCSFSSIEEALLKSRPLFMAIQTPKEKKSELQRALAGLCKFIQFCEGLSSLLARMKSCPLAADAFWLAHVYWLRRLNHRIGDNLNRVFKILAQWQVGAKNARALNQRVRALTWLIEEIAVPPMTLLKTGFKEPANNKVFVVEYLYILTAASALIENGESGEVALELLYPLVCD